MRKILVKILSVALCLFVACSPLTVVAAAGNGGAYPDGVTAEDAKNAITGTDKLLANMLPALTGGNLSQLASPMIYNSDNLSAILLGMYQSLGEKSADLEKIGIDTSVTGVANALKAYPNVSKALLKYDSWDKASLDGVDWGVKDKNGFANALSASFSPFNDVLFMILCSGTYKFAGFIEIQGGDGYSAAIVPMLNAFKCKGVLNQAQFTAAAEKDRSTMVKNIILPLLNLIEQAFVTPAATLSDALPSFAYFTQSGELEKCMDALTEPILSNKLVEVAVLLKLFDPEMFNFDIEGMMGGFIKDMTGEGGLRLAPLDMKMLSQCGIAENGKFVSDCPRAYVVIMRWLVDSFKLNSADLPKLLGNEGVNTLPISEDFLKELLSKETDALVGTLILLFKPAEPGQAEAMVYPSITTATVQYTPNLGEEDFEKVLDEIDPLLNDFVKEGGSFHSVEALLTSAIYSNANVTALVTGIYPLLEENGMLDLLKILGVDASPKGVAKLLTENKYKNAASVLSKAESWSKVSLDNVGWGFYDGSRRGFQNAICAVFRPLYPLMRVLLSENDIVIMDTITIKGADGYNTAIIPILEALGCDEKDIKTYDKYKKSSNTDDVFDNILEPVFDLVDEIAEKPVYTLTGILPNIVYFVNSGSLDKCINNLLLPVTAFSERLSGVYNMEFDTTSVTNKLDLNVLLKDMLKGTGMNIAEFDINGLSSIGTVEKRESKGTLNGSAVTYSYVKADRTGVLMTLLRVLARTLKMPGNENLLMGAMGENESFAAYSTSLSEQFAAMNEDELIEWLYNLLFKERVQVEIKVEEDYKPTIIYKPAEKDYTPLYYVGAYLGIALIVGLIILVNRKRLYG
ncbi:MAG: hypothetical protein J6D06_03590 [Clostridia bacterium]|nr:hypothetical protein [Clostridia bacterium]